MKISWEPNFARTQPLLWLNRFPFAAQKCFWQHGGFYHPCTHMPTSLPSTSSHPKPKPIHSLQPWHPHPRPLPSLAQSQLPSHTPHPAEQEAVHCSLQEGPLLSHSLPRSEIPLGKGRGCTCKGANRSNQPAKSGHWGISKVSSVSEV